MRVAIIEDEIKSQELLISILKEYCTGINIVDTARSIVDAIDVLENNAIDLAFLDVELLDGKSFKIFEKISDYTFEIVFITAYDQYAFKAFKLEAVDYLLKPFSPKRVQKAIDKVRIKLAANMKLELSRVLRKQERNRISLHTNEGVDIVDQAEIMYCSAEGAYCRIFTTTQKYFISKTLKEIESMLGGNFVRIHASHIINMSFLKRYIKADGGTVILSNNTSLPLSRSKKAAFLSRLPS